MGIIETISALDKKLFGKINGEWHSPLFDSIFQLLRESKFWIPVYFFLLLFAVLNFKKQGWYWSLFLVLTVVIADFTSSRIIKELVFRLRPCQDINLAEHLRVMVKYCPMSSSFTSSHAVSHFAIATYLAITFRDLLQKWRFAPFIWAASICYAQVYVGVHYPMDVACGAIVGMIIGYFPGKFFKQKVGLHT